METKIKELYERAKAEGKIVPRIPFLRLGIKRKGEGPKSTGPHKVKFLKDSLKKGRDYHTKQIIDVIECLFEENGEQKIYQFPVKGKDGNIHYLVERLKDFNYGDEMILEMKWAGDRNIIDVKPVDEETPKVSVPPTNPADIKDEDIPIVNEDNYPEDIPPDAPIPEDLENSF